MVTRRERAARLFEEVIAEITSGTASLPHTLMKAYHASELAGLTEQQRWFQEELDGYPAGRELPWYRCGIAGQIIWQPIEATPPNSPTHTYLRSLQGLPDLSQLDPPEPTMTDCWAGIEQVLSWAEQGLRHPLGDRREHPDVVGTFSRERVEVYRSGWFQRIRQSVESRTLQIASKAAIVLTYGDAVQEIWEGYRADTDTALARLGLEQHVAAIRDSIASTNPEQWRAAMLSCRSVLEDLAKYLWRDSQPTYAGYQLGGKPLELVSNSGASRYVNRLIAYLHCKGTGGTTGRHIETEIKRLGDLLYTLNNLDSKAHAPVGQEDARLAVITTYIMLGEFSRRTDLQPIEDQTACSSLVSEGTANVDRK